MCFDAKTTWGGALKNCLHTLAAISLFVGSSLAITGTASAAADDDFKARCSAPGVVLCKGLDTESELQAAEMGTAGDGSRQGFVDTAQKASGAGSLKFTFRAGNKSQNIGGYWETDLGKSFRTGDTLHIQYRWKATPEYFSHNDKYWNSSLKQINIHGPSSTCQGAEFTTIMWRGYPSMYTNCGDGWFTDVNTNATLAKCTGDCLLQQGSNTKASPSGSGYNCHYYSQVPGDGSGSGCFFPPANEWVTHYEIIKLGTFGGSDTVVEAFEAHGTGGYKQWHRVNNVRFNNNRDSFLSKVRFETYMTEISAAAPTNAYIWYDELVVSTQPIAAPNSVSTPKPSPPSQVIAE
jgi:hypothetical protein